MTLLISAAAVILAAAVYLFFHRASRALVVLTYNKIGQAPKSSRLKHEWTTSAALEHTLQALSRRGQKTILPSALTQNRLPAKPVMLAFMGGYQSFYTEVMPLLKKYKANACLFLAQPYVGAYNAWQNPYQEPWQNILTQAQLKEIKQTGLVEFGALDLHVRNVTELPANEAVFGVQENIFRLKKQLGLNVQAFAFWPSKGKTKTVKPELMQCIKNLVCFTQCCGVNHLKEKTLLLKTLHGQSFRARYALWTRR